MSKLKLSLDELKVQSFVTSLTDEQQMAVRGGLTRRSCDTGPDPCYVDTVTECTSDIYCTTTFACSTGITNCSGSTDIFHCV